MISKNAKRITLLLSVVYFASYLLRKNFSVMLSAITASGFDAVALGAVGSALTVSYGAGQIINGFLGDKIKPQNLLGLGLILASACNLAMAFCTTVPLMAAVWFVNGFAHAMLWPPIVKLLAIHMNDREYGYAVVRISVASSIATIILYTISPILLNVMKWSNVILLIAATGVCITVIWFVSSPVVFSSDKDSASALSTEKVSEQGRAVPLPRSVLIPTALIFIAIVLQGALRDGVGDWMPTFMADTFNIDPKNAIITGVVPCVFSIISFYAFDALHRRLLKNEVSCAGAIFTTATVSSALLLIINLFAPSGIASGILSTVTITILVSCMHGINLMLITIVPKRYVRCGKVSTVSGILNSATYVGAAIALPLFPALKTNFSWGVTIAVWTVICALGAAVCLLVAPAWRRFKNEYSDKGEEESAK